MRRGPWLAVLIPLVLLLLVAPFSQAATPQLAGDYTYLALVPLAAQGGEPPTATTPPTQTLAPTNTATPTRTASPTPTMSATNTPPPTSAAPQATPTRNPSLCAAEYPTVCIPPPPPDLDCNDIPYRRFTVLPPDRHRFDNDHDGIGCES